MKEWTRDERYRVLESAEDVAGEHHPLGLGHLDKNLRQSRSGYNIEPRLRTHHVSLLRSYVLE